MKTGVRTVKIVTIDPDSYTPVHVQLADLIRADIVAGRLTPGQALPSETALTQQHGLSRETIRRAVAILRGEGLVQTLSGRGSYVRVPAEDVRTVAVRPGADITARMPSPAERREHGIGEGVPLLVVEQHDVDPATYAADRTILHVEK